MRLASAGLGLLLVLFVGANASARTYYAANNCSGQPTPCTTNLQTALEDSGYSNVYIVANSTFTGDYRISRSLTLTGGTGATIHLKSGKVYSLRVEGTSTVTVGYLTITGRVAVHASSTVNLHDLDISGTDYGVLVDSGSSGVTLDTLTIDATYRAVDLLDSSSISIVDGVYSGGDYGVVASDATFTVSYGDIYGVHYALVLQNGNISPYSTVTASNSSLTFATGGKTTWRWDRCSASYTNVTPSPTETVSQSSSLTGLISYDPWGGP